MSSIALHVLEWLDLHQADAEQKRQLLAQVPAGQWACPGGHWDELSKHCCNRVEIREEPRFMNRLGFYRMKPQDRCLFRSPDGRGLAWIRSGGDALAYGSCEQQHCERAKPAA